MRAGLPIVASNLGALPERLAGRPASWIAAWDSPTEVWLDAFVRLWEGSLPRLERPSFDHPRITHDPPGADGFYDTGYLAWL